LSVATGERRLRSYRKVSALHPTFISRTLLRQGADMIPHDQRSSTAPRSSNISYFISINIEAI
jgi:hypothetical protein